MHIHTRNRSVCRLSRSAHWLKPNVSELAGKREKRRGAIERQRHRERTGGAERKTHVDVCVTESQLFISQQLLQQTYVIIPNLIWTLSVFHLFNSIYKSAGDKSKCWSGAFKHVCRPHWDVLIIITLHVNRCFYCICVYEWWNVYYTHELFYCHFL